METMYYIGLDVHKRTISYCVKTVASIAAVHGCGRVLSTGPAQNVWQGSYLRSPSAVCRVHFTKFSATN